MRQFCRTAAEERPTDIRRKKEQDLAPNLTSFKDDALIALDNLADRASGLVNPSIRLGVTGLSRSGKTVFISSLVHNLLNGGRLPVFEPVRSGRVSGRS